MTGPIAQQTSSTPVQRGGSGGGLADVVDLILEKGLVIDLYARVSLVGIEILTVDVRVVVASVDTYLRFAEAVNRLDIAHDGTSQGLPQFVEGVQEPGAGKKTHDALEGARGKPQETPGGDAEESGDPTDQDRPTRLKRPTRPARPARPKRPARLERRRSSSVEEDEG